MADAATVDRRRTRIAESLTAFQRHRLSAVERNRKRAGIINCDLETHGSTGYRAANHRSGSDREERT